MAVAVLVAMTACSTTSQSAPDPSSAQATTASSGAATSTNSTTSKTSATSTSTRPTLDPAMTEQANRKTCNAFQSQVAGAGLDVLLTTFDANTTSPASFDALKAGVKELAPIDIDPKATASIQGALSSFFINGRVFYESATPLEPAKTYASSYSAAIEACSDFSTAKPATYGVECLVNGSSGTKFASYRDAWPQQPPSCDGIPTGGTDLTDVQKAALSAAGSTSRSTLETLYGLCGRIGGYPTNIENFALGRLSDGQVKEAQAMLILCPDHPGAAQIQSNIDAAGAAVAAASASAQAEVDGELAKPGKHLVGPDIRPGTWQSVGDRVEDCYWEVSDSSGEIIDNNFISVAPQFTITIPSSAAGFTNSGCTFRRIGD